MSVKKKDKTIEDFGWQVVENTDQDPLCGCPNGDNMNSNLLTACKGCGKEISSLASKCPHCGEPSAGEKISSVLVLIGVVFIVLGVGVWIFAGVVGLR